MKKMVCEICGSQSIRKENGVFVCQDCGTEYSIDDAKKLLVEVDETKNGVVSLSSKNAQSESSMLIQNLLTWLVFVKDIESTFSEYFEIDLTSIKNEYSIEDFYYKNSINPDNLNTRRETSFLISFKEEAKLYYFEYYKTICSDNALYKTYNSLPFSNDLQRLEPGTNEVYDRCLFTKSTNYFIVAKFFDRLQFSDDGYDFLSKALPFKSSVGSDVDFAIWVQNIKNMNKGQLYKGYQKMSLFGVPKNVGNISLIFDVEKTHGLIKAIDTEVERKYLKYYESELLPLGKEALEQLNTALSNIPLLEAKLNVPKRFRNSKDLYNLVEIVQEGKAETWKELLQIYETDLYRNEVISKFDSLESSINSLANRVIASLNQINTTIESTNSLLSMVDSKLGMMSIQMSQINKKLTKIKRNTFITMWNTL